jgi:hypothetical protein
MKHHVAKNGDDQRPHQVPRFDRRGREDAFERCIKDVGQPADELKKSGSGSGAEELEREANQEQRVEHAKEVVDDSLDAREDESAAASSSVAAERTTGFDEFGSHVEEHAACVPDPFSRARGRLR